MMEKGYMLSSNAVAQLKDTFTAVRRLSSGGERSGVPAERRPPAKPSSAALFYFCKITSASPVGDGYPADVYDAFGGSKIGTTTLAIPLLLLAPYDRLPTGAWLLCAVQDMVALGDGEGVV